jgi:hypothetical protein
MAVKETLEQKVKNLPEPLIQEVEDFVDFVMTKYKTKIRTTKKDNKPNRDVLKGSVLKYDDPFSSAIDSSEWEVNK